MPFGKKLAAVLVRGGRAEIRSWRWQAAGDSATEFLVKNFAPLFLCAFVAVFVGCATAPQSIGEQLERDNPRMIAYLESLGDADRGRTVSGVALSDGTKELRGSTFVGSRILKNRRQHIYLFRTEGDFRAYVWVAAGGKPLVIPPDRSGSPGENAYLLSGDIYTFGEVHADDGLVVLTGASPAWMAALPD